ncbi:MAG: MotA/TolQ/ExbB proton channel family protein [Candidatus Thiodiazotropha sp. (ex Lucinoma annulata)]|nr:MotA/TolQ/ExbB proton channel family protein [Candidatus Thiodiazotropha sp. (ex Lucinoma borealis)]MCU7837873.1 MotA/TolQ/ExbB proton channel family protein [Candidatus Thiodiazotropha sp. (ex Troendleina suluensis)]MCU7865475.1 MotA/TolQ/ExbB proton channel family protein [Candidatus Thiodiazotropha sp. (ex Lucinoma borealis)]MCU7869722.1 MotA/TolQ/ExbB proton channel family protein [Candidatus Thiodiazotropha sp. (ex Lucinoma borealis)]MCU7885706.1 MotA/TolQ/ExbB proton channel family pro
MLWLPVDAITLFERGGLILSVILILSMVMWTLIIYSYLQLRRQGTSHLFNSDQVWLPLIISLVQILPLVGLLGTIEAMIDLFHVISRHGTGNIRGMAGGISQALITTMAGLVASLSGYYFSSDLQHRMASYTGRQEGI